MGCRHSVTAAIEESGGGTKAVNNNNANDNKNTTTTTAPTEERHQSPILHDDELLLSEEHITDRKTGYNVNGKCNQNQGPQKPLHSNIYPNNDDFTTDYIILKQVMVGMSALSNIYMVMRRPQNVIDQSASTSQLEQEHQQQSQSPIVPQQQSDNDVNQNAFGTGDPALTATPPGATAATNTIANDQNEHTNNNNNNNDTDEIYVLQVIDMDSVAPERRKSMRKEMIALKSIIHPNILRVHAVYDATRRDNTIATVTELCTGSHLHSSLPYPEPRAKIIIAQILDALLYMHQRGIFHNSLTTENILFQDDSQDAIIKITYAGVANLPTLGSSNRFKIPEWNPSGKDIYSVGMIAYKLLSGGKEPPTDMDTQRVVPGTNLFLGRRWKLISISKNAKNFIERCLHSWDMKPQFTVEDAIHHIWMTQEHVHRSDTSRSTETVRELVIPTWNTAGNSLTASEPTIFYPTNETVPIVSLTAEQYSRNVKSKPSDNEVEEQVLQNIDDSNIPVFHDKTAPDDATDSDVRNEIAEYTSEEAVGDNVTDEVVGCSILLADNNCIQEEYDNDAQSEHIDLHTTEKMVQGKDVYVPNEAVQKISEEDTNIDDVVATNILADHVEFSIANDPDENDTAIDSNNEVPVVPALNDTNIPIGNVAHNPDKSPEGALSSSTPLLDEDISETHTPDEFIDLRDAFHDVVTNAQQQGVDGEDDGTGVTIEKLKERLRSRYTEEEVSTWFSGHARYEDPKNINYKIFLRKVIQSRKTIEIQRVDTAFKLIDKGKHGYVTVGNLRAVLGKDNNENIEQLIKEADTNRDGTISYENFENVVQNYLHHQHE